MYDHSQGAVCEVGISLLEPLPVVLRSVITGAIGEMKLDRTIGTDSVVDHAAHAVHVQDLLVIGSWRIGNFGVRHGIY